MSDLAPMLWHSFGTMAALLQVSTSNKYFLWSHKYFYTLSQEIINIYPAINPPVLTAHQSNRVCNALALLQCVASHPDTRYGELFALSLKYLSMSAIIPLTDNLMTLTALFRSAFLLAHIPLYLYPFLHTVSL